MSSLRTDECKIWETLQGPGTLALRREFLNESGALSSLNAGCVASPRVMLWPLASDTRFANTHAATPHAHSGFRKRASVGSRGPSTRHGLTGRATRSVLSTSRTSKSSKRKVVARLPQTLALSFVHGLVISYFRGFCGGRTHRCRCRAFVVVLAFVLCHSMRVVSCCCADVLSLVCLVGGCAKP